TGFLVNVAGRTSYLGVDRVSDIGADGVVLRKAKLDLRRFERRPDEVLLRRDVLDRQLINVEGARLVRANEIELAHLGGSWRVVGVDTGPRGGLRRLLPKRLGSRIATGEFLDWACVEPFVGHVPTLRLRVPHPKLAKLHPAQIADLVEAASRREGEEIIQAVGDDDRELEADVFEELDDQHQREFLAARPRAAWRSRRWCEPTAVSGSTRWCAMRSRHCRPTRPSRRWRDRWPTTTSPRSRWSTRTSA